MAKKASSSKGLANQIARKKKVLSDIKKKKTEKKRIVKQRSTLKSLEGKIKTARKGLSTGKRGR